MPNIEIYGLCDKHGKNLRRKIVNLFKNRPWQKEYVVTVIPSKVTDENGTEQPFIRLISAPNKNIRAIIRDLETLGFDIELLELKRFIAKKKPAADKQAT